MYERTGALVQEKFREYLLPTIMTSLAMSLASVVDSILVGNILGGTALAAVGLASPLIYCINLIYMLIGIGGMTCASIARGRREAERANKIFTLTMVGGLAAMFIFAIAIVLFVGPITRALSPEDPQLAALTADYLVPLIFTGPALMFSSGMALFIRTDGQPKSSAIIVVIANAVNLVLDYLLMGVFDTGIMGAGLSTTLGYVAGCVIVVPYLVSKKRSFRFSRIGSGGRIFGDIIKTGLPKGLNQATSFFRSLCLNSIVLAVLGSIGMSVMTVCVNILMIANIFVGGTSDALLPIVGTLYGERDYVGIRHTVKSAARVLTVATAVLLAFFLITPWTVCVWFGLTGADAAAVAEPAIRLFALYLPFSAANMLLQNLYSTTGRTKLASIMAVLDGFVYVVFFALLLAYAVSGTAFWGCFACSGALTLLSALLLGKKIREREHVQGMLLLREQNEPGETMDVTIRANADQATGLSKQVLALCEKSGVDNITANRLAVAVEEMAVNTADLAHGKSGAKEGTIDVFLRVTADKLIIRFRDDGTPFDPVGAVLSEEETGLVTQGIQVVRKLAQNVDYARQLGFNTTILTFDRVKAA